MYIKNNFTLLLLVNNLLYQVYKYKYKLQFENISEKISKNGQVVKFSSYVNNSKQQIRSMQKNL